MAKQFTKIVLHPQSLRAMPEESYLLCEACGTEMRMADAWSYPAQMWLSGPDVHISLVCEEEQHFGCTHACALKLHNECVTSHLLPKHQAALGSQDVQQGHQEQQQHNANDPEERQ